MLTNFDDEAQVNRAIKAGALGYLLKGFSPNDLYEAIRTVQWPVECWNFLVDLPVELVLSLRACPEQREGMLRKVQPKGYEVTWMRCEATGFFDRSEFESGTGNLPT